MQCLIKGGYLIVFHKIVSQSFNLDGEGLLLLCVQSHLKSYYMVWASNPHLTLNGGKLFPLSHFHLALIDSTKG